MRSSRRPRAGVHGYSGDRRASCASVHFEDFCARTLTRTCPASSGSSNGPSSVASRTQSFSSEPAPEWTASSTPSAQSTALPPMVAPSVFAQLAMHARTSEKQVEVVHEAGMLFCVHCHASRPRARRSAGSARRRDRSSRTIEPPPQGDITFRTARPGKRPHVPMGYVQDQDFYTAPSGYMTRWSRTSPARSTEEPATSVNPDCTPFDHPCTDTLRAQLPGVVGCRQIGCSRRHGQ